MPYVLLALAIAAEVAATLSLRASEGFSRLGPSLIVAAGYLISFVLLAKVLTRLNVGPVYAIWSALGTVGAFVGGALLFGEQARPATVIGAAIVIAGVIVMNLGGGVHQ
ncbi:multidrug efflux SMR transporter [Actinoallomurus sp. NPDC052308]|uniref:DMT family transporter n=1 Tax=Actinoallomurus sp. NPDC052308 TaxID=3155530 RepID=UPI00341F715E